MFVQLSLLAGRMEISGGAWPDCDKQPKGKKDQTERREFLSVYTGSSGGHLIRTGTTTLPRPRLMYI